MSTLLQLILKQGNDYDESYFLKKTNIQLVSFQTNEEPQDSNQSVSVVIPCYRPTVLPLVLSKLNNQKHKNLEIILVDDSSDIAVIDIIKTLTFNFPVKVVRHRVNQGRPFSRNTGVSLAEGNTIIFLDQDMVVSDNFVSTIALRHQYTENFVFVGFRENIDLEVYNNNPDKKPLLEHDWRFFQPYMDNLKEVTLKPTIIIPNKAGYHLVNDSNFFKNFGFAKTIGYWDLPAMTVSHSLSMERSAFIQAGGFPESIFKGWGAEDLALGASLIAHGHYIVPLPNCVSFHINHQRHSGSIEKEWLEFENNFRIYREYVNSNIVGEIGFKPHTTEFVKKANNIQYYEN